MQNLTSTLGRLAVVLAGALTLGSCSRSEYAFLPRSASYLGTTTVASKPRAAAPAAEAVAPATPTAPVEVATAPTPAPATEVAVATPAKSVAASPKAATPAAEAQAVAAAPAAATTASAVPQKLNFAQRLVLNKALRKLDKQAQKITARQDDNTASTARGSISGNLKIGIILLLIGLLVGLLNGFIGTIIAIVGLIFIVLWLLDQI